MSIPPEPIKPVGSPISLVKMNLWQFSQADIDQAIATAPVIVRKYLKARER